MAEMIKNSGVNTPCYSFPQPIDVNEEKVKLYGLPFDTEFKFYSIFQWIDRKNPRGLLRAYWKAFEGNDKVCLILKTYGQNYSPTEYERIKKDIEKWKKELGLKSYPKIFLVKKLMTNHEIKRLHATGDCYVASSSGEGWNRPVQEAMLYGKPVISGSNGGITDLMDNYCHVESKFVNATEVSQIPWYTSDMRWRELDEKSLVNAMKSIYSNYKANSLTVKSAQKFVINEFSFREVGRAMKLRLLDIYETMQ
jgi:glycosyltransferase involved in cell wall biosynthesis